MILNSFVTMECIGQNYNVIVHINEVANVVFKSKGEPVEIELKGDGFKFNTSYYSFLKFMSLKELVSRENNLV